MKRTAMILIVGMVFIGYLFFVALCEEPSKEPTTIDSYQKWLIEEIVLGKYKEARNGYLEVASKTEDEQLKWICFFRAALCAEKYGNFATAKTEYEQLTKNCKFENIIAAAKMALLRIETLSKQRSRTIENLKAKLMEYRALEMRLENATAEQLQEILQKTKIFDHIALYFGAKNFLKGVVSCEVSDYEAAKRYFEAAAKWLPDFKMSDEMAKRCQAVLDEEETTVDISDSVSSLIAYLPQVSREGLQGEEMALELLNQREVLKWLADEPLPEKIRMFIKHTDERFWSTLSEAVSEKDVIEIEKTDKELSASIKRLKNSLSKLTAGCETAPQVKGTVAVLWLRVLLLDRSLKEIGAGEPLEVKGNEERSGFIYGTVDLNELRKSNPKVLAAVEWRMDKTSVELKSTVKDTPNDEKLRLSGIAVLGFKDGSKLRIVLELKWEKEGGRILSEKIEHTFTPIFGFAELFGGWLIGEKRLYCSVEWSER